MMNWLLLSLIVAGAIAAVPEDMIKPLHYGRNAHLFHYQDNDLRDSYQLDDIEESGSTTSITTSSVTESSNSPTTILSTTTDSKTSIITSLVTESSNSPTTIASTTTTTVEPGCLSPFMDIEDRCLYYNTTAQLDWSSAQKACEAINGNLIEIPTEDQDSLSEYLHNITVGSYMLGAFWTGGNDKQEEGDWLWLSGNPVDGNWGEDENNNDTKANCLLLDTRNAVYRDNRCVFKWGYLCEPGPCYDSCGINAHCDVVDYVNYTCTCNEGYEGDAYTKCTEIDPCDAGECGEHALCIADTWHRYHCECEEGYVGDPDTACEYDPCYNITCGANAECEQLSNSTAECCCNVGYTGNPDEGCTKIDPCDAGECGEHALCIADAWNSYHCECEAGYVGDPDKACESDPCYNVECGDHASCHVNEHDPECLCDEGYPHGDPNVQCSGVDKSVCCSWAMLLLTLSMTILLGHRNES